MVYQGHVQNGVIVLDPPAALPEGATVKVYLVTPGEAEQPTEEVPSLYERLKPFAGVIEDLPPDASVNVDHDLYGHPKQ